MRNGSFIAISVCKWIAGMILLILYATSISAQRINFHNISNSLPSECYDILQDSKGYIWISSEEGLYRYNGTTFKCFNTVNGMQDLNIFHLLEDSKGRILFSTRIGKVGYVNHDSVIFPEFNTKLKVLLRYGNAQVNDMYEDKNHILWIATFAGLLKTVKPYDYSDIEEYKYPASNSCDAGIKLLDKTKALSVTYGTVYKHTKLACLDYNGRFYFVKYEYDTLDSPTLRKTLLLDNGNVLWAFNDKMYLIRPDGSYTEMGKGKKVLSLYQDKTGGVWIGLREMGVLYYKDASLSSIPVNSLKGYSVSGLIMDKEGGIWATTLEKGVFYAPSSNIIDYTNWPGLDGKVTALATFGNKIVATSSGKALNEITDNGIVRVDYPVSHHMDATYNYTVSGNKIYISGSGKLTETDTAFKKWIYIPGYTATHTLLPEVLTYDVKITHKGAYAFNGANFYKLENDTLRYLSALSVRGKSIFVNDTNVLLSTSNGLYSYSDDKLKIYTGLEKLSSVRLNKIVQDNDSNLWVLTLGDGIFVYKHDKLLTAITTATGLASNIVYDAVFDENNNAWVGTDKGLGKIRIRSHYSVENYGTRHGIVSNEVVKLIMQGDRLWLGTGNGLCVIDTKRWNRNSVPPPVYITNKYANDSLIKQGNEFTHNINNYRFFVDGLTYKDDEKRFMYRLLGADSIWHLTGSSEISFNQLPPGNFIFEVKAINADGVSSTTAASFSFTIENPFWLAWWFILLEIGFLAGLTYAFIQARLKVIQNKEAEKTRINKVIAEHEVTALRTQMNPHFIFNAINSIQHFVLQNNAKEAYNYLAKFSKLIRMMLNSAREKKLSLQQELEMLQIYIQLEQLRFSESFRFHLEVDETIDAQQVFIPVMLIQPYVENAIWHGLMNLTDKSNAELAINITQHEDALNIKIRDNGIGRDKSRLLQKDDPRRSLGIELTRKRMELLNKMEGEENVDIQIKDLYDDHLNSLGTRVEIIITNIL